MKIKILISAALIGGAVAPSVEVKEASNTEEEGRLFSLKKSTNHMNFLSQKDNTYHYPESNNIDDHDAQETFNLPIRSQSTSAGHQSKNPPALSALVLLGFLYFLHLIQGTSGKKKRHALDENDTAFDDINSYLKSLEGFIDTIVDYVPADVAAQDKEARNLEYEEGRTGKSFEERANRVVSFFSSLWHKIPRFFGFTSGKSDISRYDYQIESRPEVADGGFWSMFGNKIGLVATITDFLEDPRPSRVGKSFWMPEVERDDVEDGEELAEPFELTADEKALLPSEDELHSRSKRFTDGMNAWYQEARGHTGKKKDVVLGSPQIFGMVFNLLKGALTTTAN